MDRQDELKDFIREASAKRGVKQQAEARALQTSQQHVSNYLNPTMPYYYGVHHVPDSLHRDDFMAWLGEQTNYMCIPKEDFQHDGQQADELIAIIEKATCGLRNIKNRKKVDHCFSEIIKLAEEGQTE